MLSATNESRVSLLNLAVSNLWLLGYADQAQARNREAHALAREWLPHQMMRPISYDAILHMWNRQPQPVEDDANAIIRLATEWGMPYFTAYGTAMRGWALAQQGQYDEGITQLRQGMEAVMALGVIAAKPRFLEMLAESYLRAGLGGAALSSADAALDCIAATGWDVPYQAEGHRLRGEALLLGGASADDAEASFHRALAIARSQQAKAWELRAATSLARPLAGAGQAGSGARPAAGCVRLVHGRLRHG